MHCYLFSYLLRRGKAIFKVPALWNDPLTYHCSQNRNIFLYKVWHMYKKMFLFWSDTGGQKVSCRRPMLGRTVCYSCKFKFFKQVGIVLLVMSPVSFGNLYYDSFKNLIYLSCSNPSNCKVFTSLNQKHFTFFRLNILAL